MGTCRRRENGMHRDNDAQKVGIRLSTGDDRRFMVNVMEKYLYEMSPYTGERMDIVGNYAYPRLDSYFRRGEAGLVRKLYIIMVGNVRAGFAMVNKVSPFEELPEDAKPEGYERPDWCMSEFTVFPQFRNQGVGRDAAELIMAENEGRWELQYDRRNERAKALWTDVCKDHDGSIVEVSENSRIAMLTI